MADLLQPLPVRSWADRLSALRDVPWLRPVLAGGGAVLAVAVLVLAGLAFLRSSSPPPTLTLPRADPGSAPLDGDPTPTASTTAVTVTVTVHVAGQVNNPGVYAVPAGGRVADAVVAAGGSSGEADLEQLNLAARVADGERIYVPKKGEPPPAMLGGAAPAAALDGGKAGATAAGSPVDLNTATAEQLEALPGVGPATSKAILAYRANHGRFRSVTELLEVPGIGPAKLEALRPLVRV
ncbi:MAG TPA: helix-hairpin-helix domain-containing protein [Acidimicrobiales bacterium]|nr:helix-hairpin-helix domain-containing protein [Acidimicrobiales bacterium]